MDNLDEHIELSDYYISDSGKLCANFPSNDCEYEVTEVIGVINETWFCHVVIGYGVQN